MYLLHRFGSFVLPSWNSTHGLTPSPARLALQSIPGGGRINQYGNARVILDGSSLEYSFNVENPRSTIADDPNAEMTRLVRSLNGTENDLIRYDEYNDRYQFTRAIWTINSVSTQRPKDACRTSYKSTFEVLDYGWRNIDIADWTFDATPLYQFDTGLVFDQGGTEITLSGVSNDFTLDATDSDLDVPFSKWIIRCGAGESVSNITIRNLFNNYWFKFVGTVSQNQTLTIDTDGSSARLDGENVYGNIEYSPTVLGWMNITRGHLNPMRVTASPVVGSPKMIYIWSPLYA